MPLQPRSLTPVQFLNAGNIVSAGLQIYRRRFKDYFRLSLVGTLWLIVPLVLLIGSFFVLTNAEISQLLIVTIPVGLILLIFGSAKYQAFAAAIARSAFDELIQSSEPLAQAKHYTEQRKWGFWWIQFLLMLLFFGAAIGLYIVLGIVLFILILAFSGVTFLQDPSATSDAAIATSIAAFGLVFLLIVIPALVFFLWLAARFFISEVPYAIESELGPSSSLTRSWNLTAKSSWRIVLTIFVIFAVLFPLQVLYQIVSAMIQGVVVAVDPTQAAELYGVAFIGSYVVSLALSILILPVWQIIKAIVYYDVRGRREGMGLELPESSEFSSSSGSSESSQVSDAGRIQTAPNERAPFFMMTLFNHVKLLTPESVELEFTLAGIGNRALALLIDYTVIIIGWLLLGLVWGIFSFQLLSYLETTDIDYSNVPLWLLAIGILLTFIFTTGYFIGFETLRQGQTPGKRFAKIRVIRDDGRPVGLPQAVLRSLLQTVDYIFFVGAFMIFLGKREKRIGDWAAGTLVIQENRSLNNAIALSTEAKTLATELPQQTQLSELTVSDFAVIREYLQRRSYMAADARTTLSLDLARNIRSIIQLETIPQGLTSDHFLEAVYLAYQEQFPAY